MRQPVAPTSTILDELNMRPVFERWQNSMNPAPEIAHDTLAQFFASEYCDHPDRLIYGAQCWLSHFEGIFDHEDNLNRVIRIGAEFGEPEKFAAYIIFLRGADVTSGDLISSCLFTYFLLTSDDEDLEKLRNILTFFSAYTMKWTHPTL
jgi:hypothetical protein